jgi:hypothetical protein
MTIAGCFQGGLSDGSLSWLACAALCLGSVGCDHERPADRATARADKVESASAALSATPTAVTPTVAARTAAVPTVITQPNVGLPSPPAKREPARSHWELPQRDGVPLSLAERRERSRARRAGFQNARQQILRDARNPSEPRALERLLNQIRDKNYKHTRVHAIVSLGDQRIDGAVGVLERMLRDDDVDVAMEAAIRLYRWQHRPEAMVQEMVGFARRGVLATRAFLKTEHKGKRVWRPGAVAFFEQAVRSPVPSVRIDATVNLLELDTPANALSAVERVAIAAPKWPDRLDAVGTMERVADRQDVQAILVRALSDVDGRVRAAAAKILDSRGIHR